MFQGYGLDLKTPTLQDSGVSQQCWHICRCEVVDVSLGSDTALQANVSALMFFGEPTNHSIRLLSANSAMRRAIAAFCTAGGVVYAEGAGLAYLATSVRAQGELYNMAGVLPIHVVLQDDVQAEGLVSAVVKAGCPLFAAGQELRGHACSMLDVRQEVPAATLRQRGRSTPHRRSSSGCCAADTGWAFDAWLVTDPCSHEAASDAGSSAEPAHRHAMRQRSLRRASVDGDDGIVPEGYTYKHVVATVVSFSFASNRDAVQPLVAACQEVDTAETAAAMQAATSTSASAANGAMPAHVRTQPPHRAARCSSENHDSDHSPLWESATSAFTAQSSHPSGSQFSAASSWTTALSSPPEHAEHHFTGPRRQSAGGVYTSASHAPSLGAHSLVSSNSVASASSGVPRAGASLPAGMSHVATGRRHRAERQQQLRRSHSVASRTMANARAQAHHTTAGGARRSNVWPPRVNGYVRVFSSHDLEALDAGRSSGADHTGAVCLSLLVTPHLKTMLH